jgi:uncharacterized protein (TIGR00255 family)
MKSMTGFGFVHQESASWSFSIQVKSVNSRFLDLKIHLPSFLSSMELEIRKIMQDYFHRGFVDLSVKAEMSQFKVSKIPVLNTGLLKHYLQCFDQAQKDLASFKEGRDFVVSSGEGQALSWSDLLTLPEVLQFQNPQELSLEEKEFLIKGVRKACQLCQEERLREGLVLKRHLTQILESLDCYLKKIQNSVEQESRDYPQGAHKERIQSYLEKKGLSFSEERFLEEWAYYRERTSIFEEMERLESHLKHLHFLFDADEPMGKKLDFYTQELLREFNTIGSKTAQSPVIHYVVESKSLIERLKEQVQNIQ